MVNAVVDTRLWALALKAPYLASHDSALEEAKKAQSFIRSSLKENRLLISSHLAAEIYQVLTAEGNRIPPDQARRFLVDMLNRKDTIFRVVTSDLLMRAMELSARSGIHLSDYLVALPFEDVIDVVYTIDPHFQHATLASVARIENPLGIWRTEDQEL